MFKISINYFDGHFLEFECDAYQLVNGTIACDIAKDNHKVIYPLHQVRRMSVSGDEEKSANAD